MEITEIEAVLRDCCEELDGDGSSWEMVVEGVRMACVTDTGFDRMRIIAPVIDEDDLTDDQRRAVLEANFHTALDARYATSDGMLFAAFIHPLSALTDGELRSAVGQVANLVETFGTTYSSGPLVFGTPPPSGGMVN